jgi:hypothetical protein
VREGSTDTFQTQFRHFLFSGLFSSDGPTLMKLCHRVEALSAWLNSLQTLALGLIAPRLFSVRCLGATWVLVLLLADLPQRRFVRLGASPAPPNCRANTGGLLGWLRCAWATALQRWGGQALLAEDAAPPRPRPIFHQVEKGFYSEPGFDF